MYDTEHENGVLICSIHRTPISKSHGRFFCLKCQREQDKPEYAIKEIGETYKPYFVITENAKELSREQIAKLYKPLQHYPFSNAGWAYYHLFQLKLRQGIAAKELSIKVCKPRIA